MFLMYPKPPKPKSPMRIGAALVRKVQERDRKELAAHGLSTEPLCVAPLLGGHESARCSGRATMQHVKMALGLSVRRIHIEEMLLTLCEGHHLETRAGANWATAHMDRQRRYLARFYPDFWRNWLDRQCPSTPTM